MSWFRKRRRVDPRRIHELEYELGFRDDPPLLDYGFGAGELIRIEDDFSRITGIVGTEAFIPGAGIAGRVVWHRGDEAALDCDGRAAFADVSELRPLN